MSGYDVIPEQPSDIHFVIAAKAAAYLGGLVEGNGLTADQIRIANEDQHVHRLPGTSFIVIKPDIAHSSLPGKQPQGQACGSKEEVYAQANITATKMMETEGVQTEIVTLLEGKPGRGFGLEATVIKMPEDPKTYSIVEMCARCQGNGFSACGPCGGGGQMSCPACYGNGMIAKDDGSRANCNTCHGNKAVPCTNCKGSGKASCADCGGNGYGTHVYTAVWKAEVSFELDRKLIPPEVLAVVDHFGTQKLATEGHAEIFRQMIELRDKTLALPWFAFLPVTFADYSISGKPYRATVAGLHGRVLEMPPFLDDFVKPGINALFKLSKGTLAVQALMDQACKFRMLRDVLGGLSHHSRKYVYNKLTREYPIVLSEKYAKASIKYAGVAVDSLSRKPRLIGTFISLPASALVAAGWFMSGFRAPAVAEIVKRGFGSYAFGADAVIWLLSYVAAILTVRFYLASTLQKILPPTVQNKKDHGLPPAGDAAAYTILSSLIAFAAVALLAPDKPSWIAPLAKMLGL